MRRQKKVSKEKATRLIHRRLLKLFIRITPPEYTHSAIKGRSYRTNAEAHREATNVLEIDIKKFFPSIKFACIHAFFLNRLKCSTDIATILAKLCTVTTSKYGAHLPTGSCISPILSLLANQRLFDAIKVLCEKECCKFTLYVDDITISGEGASSALLDMVAKEIFNHGYGYHKIKRYQNKPATITGLIAHKGKISLPHHRAKKIRELRDSLAVSVVPSLREKLLASLVGRLSEAEHIEPRYKEIREEVISNCHAEWAKVVASRAKKAKLAKKRSQK